MKLLRRLGLFAAIVAAIGGAGHAVIAANVAEGRAFRPEAAGAVVAASWKMAAYIFCSAAIVCLATSGDWPYRLTMRHTKSRAWVAGAFVLGHLWVSWLLAGWGLVFSRPNYYLVAVLCFAAAFVPVLLATSDLRRVRSNNSSKPTPLRGAA